MSVKQYIPAVKYGNAVSSDEVDLSATTGDVTFTAGNPQSVTPSTSSLNPAIGQTITVPLTSTQILGMYSSPVQVIPAPGTNKIVVVDSWVWDFAATSTTYTAGGVVSLIYNSSASTTVAGTLPVPNVTTGTAGAWYVVGATNTSVSAPPLSNTAVLIQNTTQPFTTGTGTAKVIINYQIISL